MTRVKHIILKLGNILKGVVFFFKIFIIFVHTDTSLSLIYHKLLVRRRRKPQFSHSMFSETVKIFNFVSISWGYYIIWFNFIQYTVSMNLNRIVKLKNSKRDRRYKGVFSYNGMICLYLTNQNLRYKNQMDVSFKIGNEKFNYRVCAMIISEGKI